MNGKNQNIVGNQYGCLTVQKLAYKRAASCIILVCANVVVR